MTANVKCVTPFRNSFVSEVLEIMQGLSKQGEFVGVDLAEVAPDYDHAGITAMLAAQLLMNMPGFIWHERNAKAA